MIKSFILILLFTLVSCVPSGGEKSKLEFKETADEALEGLGDMHSNSKIYTTHSAAEKKFYQPRYMDGSMFVNQLFHIFSSNWRTRYVLNNSNQIKSGTERFSQYLRKDLGYSGDIYVAEINSANDLQKFDWDVPYSDQSHFISRTKSRSTDQTFRKYPTIGKPSTETMGHYIKLCQHLALNTNAYYYRIHVHNYMRKIYGNTGQWYRELLTKEHVVKLLTQFLHRMPTSAEVNAVWNFSQMTQYNSGNYYAGYAAWQATQENWSRAVLAACMAGYTALVL